MKKKLLLGELLIQEGVLTEAQLSQLLIEQRASNLKLGQLIVRQGILTERQIVKALAHQLTIKIYNPEEFHVDPEMAKLVPASVAQKHHLAPLNKKSFLLTVAMPDPLNINGLDALEDITQTEVEPIICTEQELNQLFSRLYGMYADLGGVMESVTDMEILEEGELEETQEDGDVTVSTLMGQAEEAPVIRLVNSILSQAIRDGASDVHISPEKDFVNLQFRVDGKLHNVPSPPKAMFLPTVSRLKILANMDIATSRVPQDGRFSVKMEGKEVNIRASTMPTTYGENFVMRLLDMSGGIYSLELLGMSDMDMEKIRTMIGRPYGMILSTGPTGSGKTSSLYALLKEIYKPEVNIITLEDPVEYRIPKVRQAQLNRKAGMTFANGLRSILRQDPDVIMVGEIRDSETANIAVQAAMTGHLVLSTVHTNQAAGAIVRFVNMGIEPFLISSVLLVSFGQRLVRKICPNCRESYEPSERALAFWKLEKREDVTFYRGKGCFNCDITGYKGRTGVFETLVIDEMIQEMIIQRKSAQEITRAAQQAGKLRTLKEDAIDKVLQGITTLDEATSAVMI